MPSFLVTFGAMLAVVGGVGYQFLFKDIIFTSLGIKRVIQDVSDFPYACRQIRHPQFEGCEDMWLDDDKRLLYAACAPVSGRAQWTPRSVRLFPAFPILNIPYGPCYLYYGLPFC